MLNDIFISEERDLRINYSEMHGFEIKGYPTHSHPVCEILYLLDGDITHHIEGRSYKLRKYDIVFVRPYKNHYLAFGDKRVPYRRYDITCDPKYFPRELYRALPDDADVINFENNETVRAIFEKLEFYSESIEPESQKMLFSSLLCELFCQFAIAARNPKNRLPSSSNPTLDSALKYIDENLTKIENIDAICNALFITKSHLHQIFKTGIRMTPKKYINQKRLLLARRKIRHGGAPSEIYRECGFSDYTTFYRNYKSYFGYEPKAEGNAPIKLTTPPLEF